MACYFKNTNPICYRINALKNIMCKVVIIVFRDLINYVCILLGFISALPIIGSRITPALPINYGQGIGTFSFQHKFKGRSSHSFLQNPPPKVKYRSLNYRNSAGKWHYVNVVFIGNKQRNRRGRNSFIIQGPYPSHTRFRGWGTSYTHTTHLKLRYGYAFMLHEFCVSSIGPSFDNMDWFES